MVGTISIAVAIIVFIAVISIVFLVRKKGSKPNELSKMAGALHTKDVQAEILISSITDGIIVIDTTYKITLINKAAADMAKWDQEEAMGLDARLILKLVADPKGNKTIPDDLHPFTEVVSKKERYSKTLELLNREEKKIFVSLAISPIALPKSNELVGAVAVFRDVTAEKSEEQRRAEFISTASHEMRTPVAAIEGYLALAMNDRVSTIDANARSYLEKAHDSTKHLGQLFQDLLTSAKAEDGRLSSHPVVVEMGEFIEKLAQDLRFGAEKKGLEVEFLINTSSDTSGTIDASGGMKTLHPLYYSHADPDRLREVVTNLFDNAVKYTSEGKVTLGLTGNDDVVQIRIADTGPGIPPEDLPHLFQKFYRVDNSATRSVGGSGLGLFICRKIVELYNGTIWADSKLGQGSTFYINLPRLSSSKAEQLKSKEATNPLDKIGASN